MSIEDLDFDPPPPSTLSPIGRLQAYWEGRAPRPDWVEPRMLRPYQAWLDRTPTAVDSDDRAGDVAGARRSEERDDVGDLVGVRGSVERCGGPQRFGALGDCAAGIRCAPVSLRVRPPPSTSTTTEPRL